MADDVYSFGDWVRLRRQSLVLSREDLARQVGVAEVSIRKIEADERRPSPQVAGLLAQQLQLAPEVHTLFVQVARGLLMVDQLPPPIPGSARAAAAAPAATPAPALLPSSTVTFLFTDIEGSTKLWEQQKQAMPAALARHDTILRQAITAHGGHVFKTVGDAVCAVFGHAPNALAAVRAGQRALNAEAWDLSEPLRVRMALHTGTAALHDGEYVGYALSRVARLLAAGHGGQILLSQSTQELVRNHLQDGAQLRDLGVYRLKDIARPEQIFQLLADELPATFPALRVASTRPGNLPAHPTSLIGRELELADLAALVRRPDVRLVTLTGSGGTGKTRLALHVAANLLGDYPDGAWFVDLASVTDAAQVATTIARDLGATVLADKTPMEVLAAFLHEKRLLLVLDNFEQVLDAAPLLADLLRVVSGLTLLVTSRAALHLSGEHEYAVPPLALPDPQRQLTLERLTQYDAVRLFIERALAVKPGFTVTNANAPAVAAICHRLDGLPLAIELAAARIKMFAPEALLTRLNQRLQVLVGGARDLPIRQQTIRNTIAWSYDLLGTAEQALFARLGVFAGGWTIEAAEGVLRTAGRRLSDGAMNSVLNPQSSVLDGLAVLVDQSLIKQSEGSHDEPRFALLETIREYALERLMEHGELEDMRHRHAAYFLALAEEAEPKLRIGEQMEWMERLDTEYENLRAALEWSLGVHIEFAQLAIGLRLAGSLWYYWLMRASFEEWSRWAELSEASVVRLLRDSTNVIQGIDQRSPSFIRACVKTLIGAQQLAGVVGKDIQSQTLASQISTLARQIEDPALLAYAVVCASLTIEEKREGLALARVLGDRWLICGALQDMAWENMEQGNGAEAITLAEEALILARALGNRWEIHRLLFALGRFYAMQGNLARARAFHEENLDTTRALGNRLGVAYALFGLMEVAGIQGDIATSTMLNQERLMIERELGNKAGVANALHFIGINACIQGEYALGRDSFAQSIELLRELGEQPTLEGMYARRAFLLWLDLGDYRQADHDHEAALAIARRFDIKVGVSSLVRDNGMIALAQGDFVTARKRMDEGRSLLQKMEQGVPQWLIADISQGFGQLTYRQGNFITALPSLQESLQIYRSLHNQLSIADALLPLGLALLAAGDLDAAQTQLAEALALYRHMGARQRIAWTLEGLAGVAAAQAQPTRAARLWGAAESLRAAIGAPMWPVDRPDYERHVAAVRAQMTPETFDAAWAAGQARTWQQAAEEALGENDEGAKPLERSDE